MSLPNYVVNIDELSRHIKDTFSGEHMFNLGNQRIYGLEIEVNNSSSQTVKWVAPVDVHIIGIKYGVNDCRNIGYEDTFDMYIDTDKVFSNVYIKEMYEYKRFRQHRPIKSGTIVKFEFFNNDEMKKNVWFDIHYANKDIQAKVIKVICINKETGEEIQVNEIIADVPFSDTIYAPEIDGYTLINSPSYNVNIPAHETRNIELIFEYEVIKVPDIGHAYDWKFVLRWQGDCVTDLDLHGVFDNGYEVSYKEREIGEGDNRAWLDFDYTSHDGINDREDKPEVLTVLGKISDNITISINPFSDEQELSEDVTLDIIKVENGKDNTLRTVKIPYIRFINTGKIDICIVNLTNENITIL